MLTTTRTTVILLKLENWLRTAYKVLVWLPLVWTLLFGFLILCLQQAGFSPNHPDNLHDYRMAMYGAGYFFGLFLACYSIYFMSPATIFLTIKRDWILLSWRLPLLAAGIGIYYLLNSHWAQWLLD